MNATERTSSTNRLDTDSPGEQRELQDFAGDPDPDRCRAICVSTGERCEHDALLGTEYCGQHDRIINSDERAE